MAKTTISFDVDVSLPTASMFEKAPCERDTTCTTAFVRRYEKPKAFDPSTDSFEYKSIIAGHLPSGVVEGSARATKKGEHASSSDDRQPSSSDDRPLPKRPWSGILISKPLWGENPKDRPVALGAFPPSYRNMQPACKMLFDPLEVDGLKAKDALGAGHLGAGRLGAGAGLAGGFKALMAVSNNRQETLQNAEGGTGKGSRIIRAEAELERKIEERIARLKEKERKKNESTYTGWQRTASSASLEEIDIPTPDGTVTRVPSRSPTRTPSVEGKSTNSRPSSPSKQRVDSTSPSKELPPSALSSRSLSPKKERFKSGSEGTSHRREPAHESVRREQDAEVDVMKQEPTVMTGGLANLLSESSKRAETVAKYTDIGTEKGSRIKKAQAEHEKKIQERMNRLKVKEQQAKKEAAPDSPYNDIGKWETKDGDLLTPPIIPVPVSSFPTDRIRPPIHKREEKSMADMAQNHSKQKSSANTEKTSSTVQRGNVLKEKLPIPGIKYDAKNRGEIYEEDDDSRESVPHFGTWSGQQGLVVQRKSRQMEDSRAFGLGQVSFERSSSFGTDIHSKICMGVRVPNATAKYESNDGGILIVRSGDAEIDKGFTGGVTPIQSELSIQASPLSQASGVKAPIRWLQRLQLASHVLQRSIRCHLARAKIRQRQELMGSMNENSDSNLERRRKQSLSLMGTMGALGKMMKRVEKLRMLQAESAATKSGDALEEQSISDAIPRLQILFLKGNVKDFLLALNENEPAFAKFRNQIPPDVAYHFLVAISRGNDYAQLIDVQHDENMTWKPADSAQVSLVETSGQFVKVLSQKRIIKAADGEDAPKLARALGLFLNKVRILANMPEDNPQIPGDNPKMPSQDMAANWLRLNMYHVANAMKRYDKLLEYSKSWDAESEACVSVWNPQASDILELQSRGLRLLRSASCDLVEDKHGGAVVIIDAHKVFVKNKHSLASTQALFVLFWRQITTDFNKAVFKGVSGVCCGQIGNLMMPTAIDLLLYTVVVNMNGIHHCGGFCFSAARDLHAFFKDIFPVKMLNHVYFYGSQSLYGAGFITATKVIFPQVYKNMSYIDSLADEEVCISTILKALDIAAHTQKNSLSDIVIHRHVLSRVARKFQGKIGSEQILMERNNVAQQALLYKDGWYGHYDVGTKDENPKPFFEGGSGSLRAMKKKRDPIAKSGADNISLADVKGLILAMQMSMSRARIVHTEALAKACTGKQAQQCRAEILHSGGIKALVEMVDTGDSDEKSAASIALAKACIGSKKNAREALQHSAIQSLINVANCGPEMIRANACEAMANICWMCQPACKAAFEARGMQTLITVIRNGVGSTKRMALLAIAAICANLEDGRKAIALSDGWMIVYECLKSSDISLASASMKAMWALFIDVGDPYKVVKGVREMDGISVMSRLLGSRDVETERNAASAMARSIEVDIDSIYFFLRCGSVTAMLSVCERYQSMNKLMDAIIFDSNGISKVEDVQVTWTEEFSKLIPAHFLQDSLQMLSPEGEDQIIISDWFDCQRSILQSLRISLTSDVRHAGKPLAEEAAAEILRFPNGVKLIYQLGTMPRKSGVDTAKKLCREMAYTQELALGALVGMLKLEEFSMRTSNELIEIRGVRPLLVLLKEGHERLQAQVLWLLLYASMHNSKFREVADSNGLCHTVASFRIQYKNAKPKHQGWALLEMLHTLFSSEEVGGLLQTLQTGTFKEQEAASAALWHMSAMQPQKKAVLLANSSSLAFLQNIAENEDNAADVAAAKGMHSLEPSQENGVSERKFSFTEVTRRNCLNVLKMLGRVPMETEIAYKMEKHVPRQKSKLRRFLDYQTAYQTFEVMQEVRLKTEDVYTSNYT